MCACTAMRQGYGAPRMRTISLRAMVFGAIPGKIWPMIQAFVSFVETWNKTKRKHDGIENLQGQRRGCTGILRLFRRIGPGKGRLSCGTLRGKYPKDRLRYTCQGL